MPAYTHRRHVNKKASASKFNRQSRKTNRKNTKAGPMRGGTRA